MPKDEKDKIPDELTLEMIRESFAAVEKTKQEKPDKEK